VGKCSPVVVVGGRVDGRAGGGGPEEEAGSGELVARLAAVHVALAVRASADAVGVLVARVTDGAAGEEEASAGAGKARRRAGNAPVVGVGLEVERSANSVDLVEAAVAALERARSARALALTVCEGADVTAGTAWRGRKISDWKASRAKRRKRTVRRVGEDVTALLSREVVRVTGVLCRRSEVSLRRAD
jgi:hypothetical protein